MKAGPRIVVLLSFPMRITVGKGPRKKYLLSSIKVRKKYGNDDLGIATDTAVGCDLPTNSPFASSAFRDQTSVRVAGMPGTASKTSSLMAY